MAGGEPIIRHACSARVLKMRAFLQGLKKVVQRGRSEVHGAKDNERHLCGRRREGEPALSRAEASPSYQPAPSLLGQALFPVGVR